MQYMLLIYEAESQWADATPEQQQAVIEAYGVFTEELQAAGQLVAGDALELTPTASSVRVREGKALTTDGPFAETKEQLGGYYIVDVETRAQAEAWAAKIPAATTGTVEVRPVMTFD